MRKVTAGMKKRTLGYRFTTRVMAKVEVATMEKTVCIMEDRP